MDYKNSIELLFYAVCLFGFLGLIIPNEPHRTIFQLLAVLGLFILVYLVGIALMLFLAFFVVVPILQYKSK